MDRRPIKVRITGDISDPYTICITDANTGAKITNVLEVDIHVGRTPSDNIVTLTLFGAEIDLTGTLRPRLVDGELETSKVKLS